MALEGVGGHVPLELTRRLDALSAELKDERQARVALEASLERSQPQIERSLHKLERELAEGLDILAACVSEQATMTQRFEEQSTDLGELARRVESTEQAGDLNLRQVEGVETQLRQLDKSVHDEINQLVGTQNSFVECLNSVDEKVDSSRRLRRGVSAATVFAPALRANNAQVLQEQIFSASNPGLDSKIDRTGAEGVLHDTTAQAICQAFSHVVKELRSQLDMLAHDQSRATDQEWHSAHESLRRDLQLSMERSEQLSQGIDHVSTQANDPKTGHQAMLDRLGWLESWAGRDGTKPVAATHASLSEVREAMDEISMAVADDIRGLGSRTMELEQHLRGLTENSSAQLESLQAAVEELQTTVSRKESALLSQINTQVGELAWSLDARRNEQEQREEQARIRRAEQLFQKAMGRMRHMLSSTCFEVWSTAAKEAVRQKQLVRKVMMRLQGSQFSRYFGQWSGAVRAALREKQEQLWDEQQQTLATAISSLRDRVDDKFTTVETWQDLEQTRVFEQLGPLLATTVEEMQHSVTGLEDSFIQRANELATEVGSEMEVIQKSFVQLESHITSRDQAADSLIQAERQYTAGIFAASEQRIEDRLRTFERHLDREGDRVQSCTRDIESLKQERLTLQEQPTNTPNDFSDEDAISAAISDVRARFPHEGAAAAAATGKTQLTAVADELLERMEDVEELCGGGLHSRFQQELLEKSISSQMAHTQVELRTAMEAQITELSSAQETSLGYIRRQDARLDAQEATIGEQLDEFARTMTQQSGWIEDVIGDLDSKLMLKQVALESRMSKSEGTMSAVCRKLSM